MIGNEIIKALALLIFQAIWKSKGKAVNQFSETFQQTIFRASKQYHKNYRERHGTMKVLGMKKPVDIHSVYVEVNLLEGEGLDQQSDIAALEKKYRRQRRRFSSDANRKELGFEVANTTQYLMVLGGPGTGKSTFLRRIGLEALSERKDRLYLPSCIPVFIELKEFRSRPISIEKTIEKEFCICGFPDYDHFALEALKQGKLLILFDGLDEVPEERTNEVINKIQNFVDLYDKNRFVISCRTAAYRHNFRRFTDVKIAEFEDEQIRKFIAHWFKNDDSIKSKKLWQKLNCQEYIAAKELAHTPLLLTLTCLLYQKAGQFPTNRATLYEKAFRVLLEEWAGEKGLPQEKLYKGLDTKRKEILLAEIACRAFFKNYFFLTERELSEQIETVLAEMLPYEENIDGRAVLKAIEIYHGVLVENASGIYSFSHLTFQEFLTAQHLVGDYHQVEQVIQEHLFDSRWREIFLLLAGLKKADDLLLKMHRQIQDCIIETPLASLFKWVDQAAQASTEIYKPAARRAIATFLILDLIQTLSPDIARVHILSLDARRAHELALKIDPTLNIGPGIGTTIVRALTTEQVIDLSIAIAHKFKNIKLLNHEKFVALVARLKALKVKIKSCDISVSVHKKVLKYIYLNWLNSLNIQQDFLAELTNQDLKLLDRYLDANLLLLECKKSAVRLSKETWEQIEAELLKYGSV